MKWIYYEDNYFYYFRKPSWMASVFWKQESYLDQIDILLNNKSEQKEHKIIYDIFLYLQDMFGRKNEYWLINRLDNVTSWLLYFAKTPLFKQKYKEIQQEFLISKYYLVDVCGLMNIDKLIQENEWISKCIYSGLWDLPVIKVSLPIIHNKTNKERMQISKWLLKESIQWVSTYIKILYQDTYNKETTLLVCINKWVRHQIRVHLSSIGFPIVGEKLYSKQKNRDCLHLYSIGQKI